MNTKRYISAAIVLAAITSLALVLPAFAQSGTPGQGWQGRGPGMMDRANWQGQAGTMNPGVSGLVTVIDGNIITLSGHQGFGSTSAAVTFTVDATNATVRKGNATSTISAIAVGDRLSVRGTVSGTSVTATSIFDMVAGAPGWGMMGGKPGDQGGEQGRRPMASSTPLIQGNGQPVIAGTVSSVSGNTLVITNKSNVTYTVDATTAKVVKGQNTIALSAVQVGDSVIVQGTVSGTSITASSVIDQASATPPANGNSQGGNPGKHLGFFGGIGQFFKSLFGF